MLSFSVKLLMKIINYNNYSRSLPYEPVKVICLTLGHVSKLTCELTEIFLTCSHTIYDFLSTSI